MLRRNRLVRTPTLSVLCPTSHPGPLVHGALRDLRSIADEVIVAADVRVGPADLGWYADVADRLVRYEFAGSSRHWSWFARQSSADWLLLLDADEVPSRALLDALPDLLRDRRCHGWSLPIRWNWPDPATYLDEEPWRSDARVRLLRNDARLRFGAGSHDLVRPAHPIAHRPDLATYHLDVLINPIEARRAKLERYRAGRYGLLADDGRDFNDAFYLPEQLVTAPALARTPDADRRAIERCLAVGAEPPPAVDPDALVVADRETILWYSPRRVLGEGAYRAVVRPVREPPVWLAAGRGHLLWVEVENAGDALWPGGEDEPPLVRIGLRWEIGGQLHDAGRAMLPRELAPGARVVVPVHVDGPATAGPARLHVDLVHEHVRWFGTPSVLDVDLGAPVDEELRAAADAAGVVGVERAWGARVRAARRDALRDDCGAHAVAGVAPPAGLRPAAIVLAGSRSAVALARLLADTREDPRDRLLVIEPDPVLAGGASAQLAAHGLSAVAQVVDTARPAAAPAELLVIERPDYERGATPTAPIDAVAALLAPGATVLLESALEDAGLCAARDWEADARLTVRGIHLAGGGVLEAHWTGRPSAPSP